MRTIPKVIHIIWIGGDIPQRNRDCIVTFPRLNPDWEVNLWIDANQLLTGERRRQISDQNGAQGLGAFPRRNGRKSHRCWEKRRRCSHDPLSGRVSESARRDPPRHARDAGQLDHQLLRGEQDQASRSAARPENGQERSDLSQGTRQSRRQLRFGQRHSAHRDSSSVRRHLCGYGRQLRESARRHRLPSVLSGGFPP